MAEIVKKNNGNQPTTWDPFTAMREMLRWDPFREMMPQWPKLEPAFAASFEVRENADAFVFKADVPGIKKDDLEISLVDNRLQISGKREEEKETTQDTIYAYERSYGSFSRMFTLPDGVDTDHIRTALQDGVLTVVIPKKASAQPKKIPVATTTTKA